VLGLIVERVQRFGTDGDEVDQRLVAKLADQVSLPAFILLLEKEFKPLRKVFEEIAGSEIYRAERYKAKTP